MLRKGSSGLPDWTELAFGDEACGWRGDDCGDVGGDRITGNCRGGGGCSVALGW